MQIVMVGLLISLYSVMMRVFIVYLFIGCYSAEFIDLWLLPLQQHWFGL